MPPAYFQDKMRRIPSARGIIHWFKYLNERYSFLVWFVYLGATWMIKTLLGVAGDGHQFLDRGSDNQ